jgi:hypothetical protein
VDKDRVSNILGGAIGGSIVGFMISKYISNFSNLDVALSTRASEETLSAINQKVEEINRTLKAKIVEALRGAQFITPFNTRRGIREVHSLLWYKDRLLAGVGPIDGGLYDALTGEKIAGLPYGWTDMWAYFYHEKRDVVLIGPFIYDGSKVSVLPLPSGWDIWKAYWYAEDLTDPDNYVLMGDFDSGVYRVDLNKLTITKLVDYPVTWPNGSRAGVTKMDGYVNRKRVLVSFSKRENLYAYDPVQGWVTLSTPGISWMKVATVSTGSGWPIIAVGYKGNVYFPDAYAICYPEDADRVKKLNLLPREPYNYDRNENNWPIEYLNYPAEHLVVAGNMVYLIGDMYAGEGGIVYVGSLPFHVFSIAKVGGYIAVGTGAKGGVPNPYWGTDAGGVLLMRFDEFMSGLVKTPALATIWNNESIGAGAGSLPLVTAGWSKLTILFKSSASGDLVVQVDVDGSGSWEDYITRTATTKEVITIDVGFQRVRLKFSAPATVTAKAFLTP